MTNICVMELGQRAQDPGGGEGDNTAQPPVLGMSIGAFQGAKPFQLWGWNMKAQAEHLGPAWGGSSHITECVLGAQTEPSVSLHTHPRLCSHLWSIIPQLSRRDQRDFMEVPSSPPPHPNTFFHPLLPSQETFLTLH